MQTHRNAKELKPCPQNFDDRVVARPDAARFTDLPNLGRRPRSKKMKPGVIVNGIPTLTVNHFAGTITARDGEPGHITANLTKQSRAKSETDAQAQVDQIVMTFTQHGTDVVLNDGPECDRQTS